MSLWERASLEAEIIAYAVPTRHFRIQRVGEVYFIQHQHAPDQWRFVAKSVPDQKHESGRLGAFEAMAEVQADYIKFVRAERANNRQRSEVPNGSRAHGAGDGHV